MSIGDDSASTADIHGTLLYQNLFIFLWNTFPNELCPVTPGGRGTNAGLDWGGGFGTKSIGTLDMRGYGAAGLDDMGTTAANRIQVTTSLYCGLGATTCSVGSAVGLCAGMYIKHPAVALGTTITSIVNYVTITISAPTLAADLGNTAYFSIFQNAIAAGSGGGENVHVQLPSEIAAHAHANTAGTWQTTQGVLHSVSTVTDPTHFHNVTTDADGSNDLIGRETVGALSAQYDLPAGVAATRDTEDVAAIAAAKATGITVATTTDFTLYPDYVTTLTNVDAGGSQPMNLHTPTRLGTWFVKV
jgi:hypothetical protein